MNLARLQVVAAVAGGALGVAGFLASLEVYLVPAGAPALAWLAHLLVAAAGVAAGLAAARRGRQIDAVRWAVVDDPLATAGEREYAHKEAETGRRHASTAFFLFPLFLGYWLVYQLGAADLVTYLIPASALVAFGVTVPLVNRRLGAERSY